MFKIDKTGGYEKPKLTTKQKLHTAVSMLALTVIALTTATYAWFTLAASTRVNELDLEVSAGAKLKIATNDLGNDIEEYYDEVVGMGGDSVDNDIDRWLQDSRNGFNISLSDILLCPLTSGNGADFYTEAGNSSGTKVSKANLSSGSYMEYELYLIAESDMRVHLSTDEDDDAVWTHISAAESDLNNSTSQEDVEGCVRMSFTSTDEDGSDRVIIWAPRDNNSDTNLKGSALSDNTVTVTGLSDHNDMDYNNDTWVCELIANTPKLVTVRVWIEGEDPQCVNDIQKAKFRTWLHFQGTDSDNNPIS